MDIHLIQLDEIESEKRRRGESEEKKLANLLNRGDHLKKALSEGQFELHYVAKEFTTQIEAHESGKTVTPFRLVDEIEASRRLRHEHDELEREETMRNINKERQALMAQEERLRQRKRELSFFRSKGGEFLAELELGNLPPETFLLQNAQLNENDDEEDDIDDAIDQTLQEAKVIVNEGDLKLEELRNTLEEIKKEKDFAVVQPFVYDGSLGPSSYRSGQRRAFTLSLDIVNALVDSAVSISSSGRTLKEVESLERHWEAVELAFKIDHDEKQTRLAIHTVLDELISETMMALFKNIMGEIQEIRTIVSDRIKGALIDVLVSFSGQETASKPQRDMLGSMFDEIRRLRSKQDEKEATIRMSRATQKLLHPIQGTIDVKPSNKKAIAPEDQTLPTEDEIGRPNSDAVVLKVRQLPTMKSQLSHLSKRISIEKQYWQNIDINMDLLKYPHNVNHCSIVRVSRNGQFMAGASLHGELYVWDIKIKPPLMLRRIPSMPKSDQFPLISLEFSWNQTDLLTLNSKNIVQVWSTLPNRVRFADAKKHSPGMLNPDCSKFHPPTVYPSVRVSSSDLERPVYELPVNEVSKKSKKKSNKKEEEDDDLRPTCTTFHPGISMLSYQPSIVIGTANGTLMKWNSEAGPKSVDLIHGEPQAIFEAPLVKKSGEKAAFDDSSQFITPPQTIKREFFHSHREEIIYIGYVDNISMTLVTVSKSALICLWPYTKSSFVGYCWYTPSHKFMLDARIPRENQTTSRSKLRSAAIEQVRATSSGGEIVIQFFYPPEDKTQSAVMRFYIFDVKLFDLSSIYIEAHVRGKAAAQFAITPFFRGVKSDFLILLLDNAISVFSLVTGQLVMRSIGLIGKNEPAHPITTLSVGGERKVTIATTGAEHNRITLITFSDFNSTAIDRSVRKAGIPSRYRKVPRDTMIPQLSQKFTPEELNECIVELIETIVDGIINGKADIAKKEDESDDSPDDD